MKYKSEIIGKGGVTARVVAHSKSAYSGKEIVTFEYEAPKCILAEINTHRLFSRNAQSSRAVPVSKVIEQIRNSPVTPIYWGSNQAGMVAGEEINNPVYMPEDFANDLQPISRNGAWKLTALEIANLMESWDEAGYHKQIVNRIGEAFTMIKGVITATEFDNFFHLRIHPAADPFIQELARCMWEALQQSEAEVLYEGEWHTPYVNHCRSLNNELLYWVNEDDSCMHDNTTFKIYVSAERAKQISAAACAQVSFRKLDLSDETIDRVYSRLVDDETPHASCVEHQATPMEEPIYEGFDLRIFDTEGVSHLDQNRNYWSGNFKHWIQNRKLLPNEACNNYKG